jgi:hypothetical protein
VVGSGIRPHTRDEQDLLRKANQRISQVVVQPHAQADPWRQAVAHYLALPNSTETETDSDAERKIELLPAQTSITGFLPSLDLSLAFAANDAAISNSNLLQLRERRHNLRVKIAPAKGRPKPSSQQSCNDNLLPPKQSTIFQSINELSDSRSERYLSIHFWPPDRPRRLRYRV